jgi:Fe-S-cluster containining protein
MGAALQGKQDSRVPCGDCAACCTSSQFVHIGPDETDTIAQIPAKLLFPAPGLPRGHVLLGYDDRGHCPMLVDGRCSIYEHRPRTCRTYDCRVFPAADVSADDDKIFIVRQSRRWSFGFPTAKGRLEHEAVRAAARFLVERRDELPARIRPANATQLAVLALEVHRAFLTRAEPSGRAMLLEPTLDAVIAAVTRSEEARGPETPREGTRRKASRGTEAPRATTRRAQKRRPK